MFFLAQTKISQILEATVWQWATLAVVIIVMIILVVWIKGWLHEDDDPANDDHQMLAEIAELQRRGELSGEEYRSIKGQLVSRLNLAEDSSLRGKVNKTRPDQKGE